LITLSLSAQTDSTQNKKQDTIKIGNMVIVGDHSTIVEGGSEWTRKNRRKKNNGVTVYSFKDTLVSINDDTIKVGRINIINKSEGNSSFGQKDWESLLEGDFKKTKISIEKSPKKLKPISTNWWILDIGYANFVDRTQPIYYTAMPSNNIMPMPRYITSSDLKLNNVKSSNVNIWIVQQKASLYKNYLNLKYGVGFEMYNFRFEQPISFSNTAGNNIYFDNVKFSKNKLFVEYLTVPVQLNFQSNPDNNRSFYASLGVSTGYLLQSHTKQISEERGKRKVNGNFNLNNFKMATIGELGVGSIRLYGSFNSTNLFDKNMTNLDLAPFAVGVRFSNL
jgi:hypothetical protein